MSNIEIIDNKMQAVMEVIEENSNNDIYILSLDEHDDPYLERLDTNPLDAVPYLLNNDDIFFIRKVKI